MKTVFVNGCFDVLHVGHVRLLRAAAAMGDKLIVGINSDESVRNLKGPARPINTAEDRREMLEALDSVDSAIEFLGHSPASLIEALAPSVIVKGAEYDGLVPADELAAALGAPFVFFPMVEGCSTTALVAAEISGVVRWVGLACNDCGMPWTPEHVSHGESVTVPLEPSP